MIVFNMEKYEMFQTTNQMNIMTLYTPEIDESLSAPLRSFLPCFGSPNPSQGQPCLHAEGHTALLSAASSGIRFRRMWRPGRIRRGDMAVTRRAALKRRENHLWFPYLKHINMLEALVNEANWQTVFFGNMTASGFPKMIWT